MKTAFTIVLCFSFIHIIAPVSAQEGPTYKFVIHAENPIYEMTKEQLSALLLKKRTKWANNKNVVPVYLSRYSAVRKVISQEILGKTMSALDAYWQQKIFSGRDVPPLEKASDSEVLAYIQGHPNAIGYISASTKLDGKSVKLLHVKK